MSDSFTTLALIAGILFVGYAVFLLADRWIHQRGEVIASGFLEGVPIPLRRRWLMLFMVWLPNVLGVALFAFIGCLLNIGIAQRASEPFAENVAYLSALFFSVGGVFWALLGPSWFIYYLSILRQGKQG